MACASTHLPRPPADSLLPGIVRHACQGMGLLRYWLLAVAIFCSSGCATSQWGASDNPYNTPQATERNPLKAQELTLQAADMTESDPEKAEQLLREALTHDLFHGPGHNNL